MNPRTEELFRQWLEGSLPEKDAAELLAELEQDPALLEEARQHYRLHRMLGAQVDLESFAQRVVRSVAALRDQAGAAKLAGSIVCRLHKDAGEPGSRRTRRTGRHRLPGPHPSSWRLWFSIAACLAIAAGVVFFLTRPVRNPPVVIAEFVSADEGVTVTSSDGKTALAQVGTQLCSSDLVEVPSEGMAKLQYLSGSAREETTVELFADGEATFSVNDGAKRVELMSGALACEAARQPEGRPMLLVTPNATATVVGTRFWLEVYGEETTLAVEKGTVVLARDEQRLDVDAGQTAMASTTKGVTYLKVPVVRQQSAEWPALWAFAFARHAQARLWMEMNQYDRARREYKAALAKAPPPMADLRSYLYMLIGDSYAKEKNWIEAEKSYLKAKKIGLYGDRKKQVPEKLKKVRSLADAQREKQP